VVDIDDNDCDEDDDDEDNNNLIDAGDGNDTIRTGGGQDWIAGGKGNDTIDAGPGNNLFAFNRGDGADVIHGGQWGGDTISIGQGIRYADLTLAKSGNDLVLGMGQGESITLEDWYLGSRHRGVETLQMVTIAGGDYVANATDRTRNNHVEFFDFEKLVQRFDKVRASTPTINQWAVMNGLLEAHLTGSNGIGLCAAQDTLACNFNNPQSLHSRSQLEQGAVKLD
jgi:Ca2+-binding RTX toxin-like protein